MTEHVGTVAHLARFPVKSMLGDAVDSLTFTNAGAVGDRAHAVVDRSDGTVASAKNPRKWRRLLECHAEFVEPPETDGPTPPVEIHLPDGSSVRSDRPDIDKALSLLTGRDVALIATPPTGAVFEEFWPRMTGLAPEEFIRDTAAPSSLPADRLSQIPLSLGTAGSHSFFDYSTIHVLTTSTLGFLHERQPHADFNWRRFRPNVVIETSGSRAVENDWCGRELILGARTRFAVEIPTMRCVMTTLRHGQLPEDRSVLRAVADHNQQEIPGFGTWACAGVYGNVIHQGTVAIHDPVLIS